MRLPQGFHRAFHQVFGNLTLEEAHMFLDVVMVPGKEWTEKELYELRQRFLDWES